MSSRYSSSFEYACPGWLGQRYKSSNSIGVKSMDLLSICKTIVTLEIDFYVFDFDNRLLGFTLVGSGSSDIVAFYPCAASSLKKAFTT